MNRLILMTAMVFALFSMASVNAKDADAKGDKAVQTQQQAPDVAEFDKQMAKAQENLKLMQEQMDKIQKAQDPKERDKLIQDHWNAMQNGMGMMQGMWNSCMTGWPMMNGGMMGGHMMMNGNMMGRNMMGWKGAGDYYSKLTPEQMKQHQYMMDQYMGMQQMMMNQMMQHQNSMWMMQPSK